MSPSTWKASRRLTMSHLFEQTPEQLEAWLIERSEPRYRAAQVRRWLFGNTVAGFEQMTDLAKPLRGQLADEFELWTTRVAVHKKSNDGTEKLLLDLSDGNRIECVLLRDDKDHRTICISTQVGCAMGCVFCASGLAGVVRNLTTGEIVEEMLQLKRLLPEGERLSHIVVMGMGEPLLNLDCLLPALDMATRPDGLGISVRRITISTVGHSKGDSSLRRDELPVPSRRFACTRPTTNFAVASCPRTGRSASGDSRSGRRIFR